MVRNVWELPLLFNPLLGCGMGTAVLQSMLRLQVAGAVAKPSFLRNGRMARIDQNAGGFQTQTADNKNLIFTI